MPILITTEDQTLLDSLPQGKVPGALNLVDDWLDYFAAPDHDTPVGEEIVDAVLALADRQPVALPDNPTAEQVEAGRAYDNCRTSVRIALPSTAQAFTRNPAGLLAALVRLAQA